MVTSHDVARLAGVSQATVSRALRAVSGTSPETIMKVREAARALGYVPSDTGRALSTRTTRCIGVVAGELTNPFYPEFLQPIRDRLEERGYRMLLIPDSPESPVTLTRMADGTFDGAIVATAEIGSRLPADLATRHVPLVLANRVTYGPHADKCHFDNAEGAAAAAAHVLDFGHRRIGLICGPHETSTGRERENAYLDALRAAAAPVSADLVTHGAFTFETGYQSAMSMLTSERPPTALLCGNDVIAIGACNAIAHLGLQVGRDVSVVGFDDISMASWDTWSLTTVRCDLSDLAAESVRMILARIEDPNRPLQEVTLPTRLVQRSSVGPVIASF